MPSAHLACAGIHPSSSSAYRPPTVHDNHPSLLHMCTTPPPRCRCSPHIYHTFIHINLVHRLPPFSIQDETLRVSHKAVEVRSPTERAAREASAVAKRAAVQERKQGEFCDAIARLENEIRTACSRNLKRVGDDEVSRGH
jgi:hypothetical protein